jgi:prepilin-type N-terminal cleavage/methylation domain-containing protein
MTTTVRRRLGFTLIEMLVVIGIILVLATLGVVFYPKLADTNTMIRASDKVSLTLANARTRAKRDNLPTGVRFELDPSTGYVTQLEYIQQPDNYTVGQCLGSLATDPTIVCFAQLPSATAFRGAAAAFDTPDAAVQPGDYLEAFGGGGVFKIQGTITTRPTGAPGNGWLKINNPTGQVIGPASTANLGYTYRIIRQPRLLISEDPITLPKNMVIDLNPIGTYNPNLPIRQTTTTKFLEVLFAPSGSVIGQGTGSDKIILWVHDLSQPTLDAPNRYAGSPILISVQVRTGFIAVQPVGPQGNEILYTRDPRSSGL